MAKNAIVEFKPSTVAKLASVDPKVILERVAAGDMLREIAKDYGVTQPAVSHYIKAHVDPDVWRRVRDMSIAARLEKTAEDLERADDPLMLARARESARLWMWRAEREHGHIYQTKPAAEINLQGKDMSVQIVSYSDNKSSDPGQLRESDSD